MTFSIIKYKFWASEFQFKVEENKPSKSAKIIINESGNLFFKKSLSKKSETGQ